MIHGTPEHTSISHFCLSHSSFIYLYSSSPRDLPSTVSFITISSWISACILLLQVAIQHTIKNNFLLETESLFMSWIKLPGIEGLVYEPKSPSQNKRKHNCRDCYYCQMCSDERCELCKKERCCLKLKHRKKWYTEHLLTCGRRTSQRNFQIITVSFLRMLWSTSLCFFNIIRWFFWFAFFKNHFSVTPFCLLPPHDKSQIISIQ